eukprot:1184737-Rhodomonas_salina.1
MAMSDKEQDADPKAAHNALEMMQLQYRFGGITLMIVWTACAIGSLATYKPHRIVHNSYVPLLCTCGLRCPLLTQGEEGQDRGHAGSHGSPPHMGSDEQLI